MQPLISIITPNYNASKFIAKTIESVQKQTYENWEMIIVDDCSIDNSIEIVENFSKQDSRIQLLKLKVNGGPAIARNKGIEVSKGNYIAFLDSDDFWKPTKLSEQLKFMITNNYLFSFTSYISISEKKTKSKLIIAKKTVIYDELLTNNYIGCLTVMYNANKLGKIYFPKIMKRQDWAMWLKITKKNITAYGLQIPLAFYTRRNTSVSSNKLKLFKYNWIVYRKFEHVSFFKSVILILLLSIKRLLK